MLYKTETDFNDVEELPFDPTTVRWYYVKDDLSDTEQEKQEMIIAIKEQITMGIIHPNGIPIGISPTLIETKQTLTNKNYPKQTKQNQNFYNKFGLRK
jgi:hypothetical protein